MSVYYNSVGEGWFKKDNNVVNESKYSVDDMNITYRKNEVNGMKKLEIEIDEMDENSKEVKDFLSKFLDKNDVYAAQDVIHDYIKGLKNKDVDEVYIAFESKDNVVNEEMSETKLINEVEEMSETFTNLSNIASLIISSSSKFISVKPIFDKIMSSLKDLYKKIGNLYKSFNNKDNFRIAIEKGVKSAGRNALFLSYDSRLINIINNLLSSEYDNSMFNERDIIGY